MLDIIDGAITWTNTGGQIVVLGLWLMGVWGFAQITGVHGSLPPPYRAPMLDIRSVVLPAYNQFTSIVSMSSDALQPAPGPK